jgi:hypothetical protein
LDHWYITTSARLQQRVVTARKWPNNEAWTIEDAIVSNLAADNIIIIENKNYQIVEKSDYIRNSTSGSI